MSSIKAQRKAALVDIRKCFESEGLINALRLAHRKYSSLGEFVSCSACENETLHIDNQCSVCTWGATTPKEHLVELMFLDGGTEVCVFTHPTKSRMALVKDWHTASADLDEGWGFQDAMKNMKKLGWKRKAASPVRLDC